MPSTLLTIAVGRSFPTTTVLNDLYGKFHTSEDKSLPLVLPIDPFAQDSAETLVWIKGQLLEFVEEIASGVARKQLTVADLEGMDNNDILDTCRRWYNECSVKTLLPTPLPEKIWLVTDLKERFNVADVLMRRAVSERGTDKPLLLSNLRKNLTVGHLTSLREKLNNILAQLNKGRLFEHLSDVEKSEFLAFGNKVGKFSVKAGKYRGADTERVLRRLKDKARSYTPTAFEQQLTEVFNLCSLAEIWGDIKDNEELVESLDSMPDVFKSIAFYGRGLQLLPRPECCQLNPWVVTVADLPKVVKIINTIDLYKNGQGELTMSGESHNNLLILGGSPEFLEVETHAQTFTVAGWMYYHKDARLAMVAAVLVYLLKSSTSALQQWQVDELGLLRSVLDLHTPSNSRWWHEYMEMFLVDPRKCLVTESIDLPPSIRCQGLNKFVLALWRSIDEGVGYDFLRLRHMMLALVIEFLGRCKADIRNYVKVEWQALKGTVENQLNVPWMAVQALAKAQHTSKQHLMRVFEAGVVAELRKTCWTNASVHIHNADLQQLRHFHMSLAQIDAIFTNLARMCDIANWGPITDDELIRALLIVETCPTSLARSSPCAAHLTAPIEDVKKTAATVLAAESQGALKTSLCFSARERLRAYLQAQHTGLPRRIPDDFVKRYSQETGRDIAKDYQVSPTTGLSAVACCFPGCDLFLVIPHTKPGIATCNAEKKRRSLLKMHLADCCRITIPGLHKCVAGNVREAAVEVQRKVEVGQCLKPPFPSRSFGNDPQANQGGSLRQKQQLQRSIDSYTNGDSKALYHLIVQLQETLPCSGWGGYAAFKEAFDAKYV
jgi:hypothetical protein